jgi:excinuclease UvrABC nuclease subunit
MAKDPAVLRKKFLEYIERKWYCFNTYDKTYKDLIETSGVYIFVKFNRFTKEREIVYVGSSINLKQRRKIHKVPSKIERLDPDSFAILFFIEMKRGFYDYEIKLINRLKPIFNSQHKKEINNAR